MKNYKKKYDTLYRIDGINYSGVTNLDNSRSELEGKYQEANMFLKELPKYEFIEVLEVGASVGHASKHFPNYTGVEYSQTAVDIGKSIYGNQLNLIQSDARKLPFYDNSKGYVFSINVLEHIPEPDLALDELIRVTKHGGYVYLDPAYNCRNFTVKKLEARRYSELGLFDKLEKLMIPILNNVVFRAIIALPTRMYLETLLAISSKPINLTYRKMSPDFDLIEKYGHVSDDDAFSGFDKHSIIIYFISRGYKVLGYSSVFNRIFCRTGPVIVEL
jgi:SAM-dependent methyltransferase